MVGCILPVLQNPASSSINAYNVCRVKVGDCPAHFTEGFNIGSYCHTTKITTFQCVIGIEAWNISSQHSFTCIALASGSPTFPTARPLSSVGGTRDDSLLHMQVLLKLSVSIKVQLTHVGDSRYYERSSCTNIGLICVVWPDQCGLYVNRLLHWDRQTLTCTEVWQYR